MNDEGSADGVTPSDPAAWVEPWERSWAAGSPSSPMAPPVAPGAGRLVANGRAVRGRRPSRRLVMAGVAGMALLALVAAGVVVATRGSSSDQVGLPGVEPVWASELVALVPAVPASRSVIVLVESGERDEPGPAAQIAALDPSTGRQRWAAPAIAFLTAKGEAVSPLVVDGGATVVWPRPFSAEVYSPAALAAADTGTGEQRWRLEGLKNWSTPRPCQQDSAVCLVADRGSGTLTRLVVDARTGRVRDEIPVQGPRDLREVGENLFWSYKDRGLTAITDDGARRWRTPTTVMFGETAAGLQLTGVEAVRRGDVYLASVRHGLRSEMLTDDPSMRVDRADYNITVGIGAATGELLWGAPGATLGCPKISFDLDHPVRCVFRGALGALPDGAPDLVEHGVTIEGFDIGTGRATWALDAGDAWVLTGLIGPELESYGQAGDVVQRIGESRYLLRLRGETTVLDLDRGPVSAAPQQTGWCAARHHQWSSLNWSYPCVSDESDAVPPSPAEFGGALVGDHYVWLDSNGRLHGGAVTR